MVYAGKIAEKKGVKSLIRALGKLCLEKDPFAAQNVRVFLAGGAGNQTEYEEIRRMAGECPCRIEFAGKLGQQKLAELYNACDLFVLPSFYEGLAAYPGGGAGLRRPGGNDGSAGDQGLDEDVCSGRRDPVCNAAQDEGCR